MISQWMILISALSVPALAWSQSDDHWRRQLGACLAEPEAQARFSCLEAVARRVADSPARDVAPAVAPAVPPAAAGSPGVEDPAAADAPLPLEAAVLRARQRPRGQWLLELDNGQSWTELQRGRVRFRPGMMVRIEPGFTGSHLLTTEDGSVVRVRPVDDDG